MVQSSSVLSTMEYSIDSGNWYVRATEDPSMQRGSAAAQLIVDDYLVVFGGEAKSIDSINVYRPCLYATLKIFDIGMSL